MTRPIRGGIMDAVLFPMAGLEREEQVYAS